MSGKGCGRGSVKAENYTGPLRKPGETQPVQAGANILKEAVVSVSDTSQDDVSKPGLDKQHLPEERPEGQRKHTANEPNADLGKNIATKEVTEGKSESQKTNVEKDIFDSLGESEENTQTNKESDGQIKPQTSGNTAYLYKTPEMKPPISSLSTEALEFVPGRGAGNNTTSPRAIASILVNAVNAPVFVPRNQRIVPSYLRRRNSKAEDALVNTVKDVILNLTESPGEFDEQRLVLSHTWSIRPCNEKCLLEIVDLIFEQSVLEPNFRSTGSKLADYLSSHQDRLPGGENFRTVFMNRCGQEHIKKDELLSNPETVSRVLGFALFLGELFCNFKINDMPVLIFLKGLLELLDALVKQCSDDCMNCVGLVLKMTGYLIDDDSYVYKDFKATSERINKLFKQIEAAVQDSSALKRSTKELLRKVLDLRASKWGQAPSDAVPVVYFGKEDEGAEYLNNYYFDETPFTQPNPTHQDDLTPVTNPDQWSDYHDENDSTDDVDFSSYYFPQQYYQEYDPQDYAGSSYDEEDIEQEFEQFQAEEEQGYSTSSK